MKILIVDGNEKNTSDKYIKLGMSTQFQVYEEILQNLFNKNLNITTIHPACLSNYLPKGLALSDVDGFVWTGSALNIYDSGPSIERQIELAKHIFQYKNKIFGSCWGLQVLATAAGGKIRKNPKGLEAVIAKDIIINNSGLNHPMYESKPAKFDAFCWHYDEVELLPPNTDVHASNNVSDVQSFSFSKGNSEIWAVQYHPEFNPKWISGLMNQRKSNLLEEGIYKDVNEFNCMFSYLSDIEKFANLGEELNISKTLINQKVHTLELFNWLKYLKKSI